MNPACSAIRPLMYLRSDELTDAMRVERDKHIHACPDCAGEAARVEKDLARAVALLREHPAPCDEKALVDAVMAQIPAARTMRGEFRYRIIQYACAASLAVMIGTASLQSYSDAVKLRGLENTLVRRGETGRIRGRIDPAAAGMAGMNGGGVQWFLDVSGIAAAPRQPQLDDYLRKKYPHLCAITLNDGIDPEERRILEREGTALLQELSTLIKTGALPYEK